MSEIVLMDIDKSPMCYDISFTVDWAGRMPLFLPHEIEQTWLQAELPSRITGRT